VSVLFFLAGVAFGYILFALLPSMKGWRVK
jgi:hypothetical protein